ncbi:MAG: hypothetical protein IKV97_04950 [Clostridia bacterium]|nr:hypothetical protein [Clostridia bacterium]
MAYNFVKASVPSVSPGYYFTVKEFSGGLCKKETDLADNQVCELDNMFFSDGKLMCRGGLKGIAGNFSGAFHSRLPAEYFENAVFHCGDALFRFDGENVTKLMEGVPDCSSVMVRINSKVYVYTEQEKIYEIDRDFNVTEKQPYIPHVTNFAFNESETFDFIEDVNMMTRYIKCTYTKLIEIDGKYELPFDVDKTREIRLFVDGERVESGINIIKQNRAIVVEKNGYSGYLNNKVVSLEYAVKNSEKDPVEDNAKKIFGSRIAFCYGGTSNDGTRVFLTGNDEFPGWYFRSELADPLYFSDMGAEHLGDGSERITGAEKRYEKLFFFTESRVFSMTYSFSENYGAIFDIKEVNTPVGCTMRGTVQAVDNTIVFADKASGVHILQSTDIFDELNVKHISANISDSGEHSFARGENFCSCDYDRKYFIFDGKELFMWDYGRTPYYTTGDHKKAEERLSWHRFTGFSDCVCIFSLSGQLYFITDNGGCSLFKYDLSEGSDTVYTEDTQEENDVVCGFKTKSYDFDVGHMRKKVEHISFDYRCDPSDTPHFEVRVYGDGEEICRFAPFVSRPEGRIKLKIPTYYAKGLSLKFSSSGGVPAISNLTFCARNAGRMKHTV